MKNKKDLAKIALTALVIASAAPTIGIAGIEAHGAILAVGCPAHGCPAAKNSDDRSGAFTETKLLGMLSPQGRTIYHSLDPTGKALALELGKQDSYRDKDLAVKEAQQRMFDRENSNR